MPCGHREWWARGLGHGLRGCPSFHLLLTPGLWLLLEGVAVLPPRRKASVASCPASGPSLASLPGAALSLPQACRWAAPLLCISGLQSSLWVPRPALVLSRRHLDPEEARLLFPDNSGGACFRWDRGGGWDGLEVSGWVEADEATLLCRPLWPPPHTRPRLDDVGFTLHLCVHCPCFLGEPPVGAGKPSQNTSFGTFSPLAPSLPIPAAFAGRDAPAGPGPF